eukprot:6481606-Amphidinium_carterae.1
MVAIEALELLVDALDPFVPLFSCGRGNMMGADGRALGLHFYLSVRRITRRFLERDDLSAIACARAYRITF